MIRYDVRFNVHSISPACTYAEKIIAVQVMKDTRPYVPALTMSLNQRTRIIGNHIIYPGPYARYLYEGKVMVDATTGKGPMKIPDVGYRFHKGAKLKPTNRPLQYTKTVHPKATDHWIDASIAANKTKWTRVAKEAIKAYGK